MVLVVGVERHIQQDHVFQVIQMEQLPQEDNVLIFGILRIACILVDWIQINVIPIRNVDGVEIQLQMEFVYPRRILVFHYLDFVHFPFGTQKIVLLEDKEIPTLVILPVVVDGVEEIIPTVFASLPARIWPNRHMEIVRTFGIRSIVCTLEGRILSVAYKTHVVVGADFPTPKELASLQIRTEPLPSLERVPTIGTDALVYTMAEIHPKVVPPTLDVVGVQGVMVQTLLNLVHV